MTSHEALADTLTQYVLTWGPLLLVVVGSILLGIFFEKVVIRALKTLAKSTETELDDIIIKAVHPALLIGVVATGIWVGAAYLAVGIPPSVLNAIDHLGAAIVALVVAYISARLVRGLLQHRARAKPEWQPVARLGSRLISLVVYIVALLVVLGEYGISITPIITSLGIAGLAVALALQDTLSNFFAGVWLQTGRHLKPGHYVKLVDQNLEGYVVDVGWRTSQIRQLANNLIVIPNSRLAQAVIIDHHLPTPRMSLLVPVSVGYEADPDHVERVLVEEAKRAAEEVPGLLPDPAPFVRFIPGFGDYSLNFTLICQVREFVDQFIAQHELRKRILARFRTEGIRIPYPLRETVPVPPTRADVAPKA